MTLKFVTLHTLTRLNQEARDPRNVTIAYDTKLKEFSLLGGLEHNTILLIDQKILDDLQKILDEAE